MLEPRIRERGFIGMSKSSIRNNPEHWRRRAEESRRLAEEVDDPVAKEMLLEVAKSYEQLATLAEAKTLGKTPS